MNKIYRLLVTVVAIVALIDLSSCTTQNKITYFQDADLYADTLWSSYAQLQPVLAPKDELSIVVTAENMSAVSAFNKPLVTTRNADMVNLVQQPTLLTYIIDTNGNIDFPILGKVPAAGKTTEQLEAYLKMQIEEYAKNPIVDINLISFPVMVMGEVMTPGVTMHSNKNATLFNALAQAGDLTIYGDRTNILLIREENGMRVKHRIDLTKTEILTSPYYYLKQQDVIVVSPNKARRSSSNYNSMKQQNLSMISAIVSVVSVLSSLAIALWK